MNENLEREELPAENLLKENAKLLKDNEKIKKRLDRVTQQGDRQHKQFEKLNEKLATYIDVIDDHVITVTIDKDKIITNVSTAFSNVFGFKSKEIIGTHIQFLIFKDDYDRLEVEIQDSLEAKQPWRGEIKYKNKSEKLIWTNTIITANYDGDVLYGFTLISEDISKEKELKDLKAKQLSNKDYDQSMLTFMSSKSSALLQRTSNSFSYVLWIIFATVVWSIVWANYAELEELTRGSGKIIPSKQIKKVESFDDAKIERILVGEGDRVKKGQILLTFNNIDNSSTFKQNALRLEELHAKSKRLELESKLIYPKKAFSSDSSNLDILQKEMALYKTDMKQLSLKTSAMSERINQKKSELSEAIKKESNLQKNYTLLGQELKIKEKMAKEKIISEVEYIQLKRQKNDLSQELNQIKNEIIRAKSSINELKQNSEEVILEFQNSTKKEYFDVLSEIAKLSQVRNSLSDQLKRAQIISPVDGTIKKMYVNTIGEVAQVGSTLLEIVPSEDRLMAEVKIAPEDIAYLRINQDAMMKFSAYDFGIYGGIKAKISYISADTILDLEDGQHYYIIYLKLDRDSLGDKSNPLPIKIGMVADVDIIHGKKSVMDYILKPILKAKQTALTEK